jgi:adenylate cyclase
MAHFREGPKGSEARLWRLIERRAELGEDTTQIDRQIWDLFGEEWAVVFTDLSGFSRRVREFGILHFLQVISEHHRLLVPIIEEHDGLLVKADGDSLLLLFRRPARGVECVEQMMSACQEYNRGRHPSVQILLCAGIGFGKVLRIGDADVWGEEVNLASKLGEDTANAFELLATEAVRGAIAAEGPYDFVEQGQAFESNQRVYRVSRRVELPANLRT